MRKIVSLLFFGCLALSSFVGSAGEKGTSYSGLAGRSGDGHVILLARADTTGGKISGKVDSPDGNRLKSAIETGSGRVDETKIPVAFCVGMLITGECLDWSCQNTGTIEITVGDKYGETKYACDFDCPTGTKPDADGNCDCEIDIQSCEEL